MICKNNIDVIKKIQNSDEFYYKKLQDIFNEFERYSIEEDEINFLEKKADIKPFSFEKLLKDNQKYKEFLLLIGRIISMSDSKGYNKNTWNLYNDKRVIATANVRQNIWTKNLLLYKKIKTF